MKRIFLISGDFIGLGKEEVISLLDIDDYEINERLLIAETNENKLRQNCHRLALTKNIFKHLFECKIIDLISMMEKFPWNSIYKDSFCLRIHNFNNRLNSIKKPIKINKKSLTTSGSRQYGGDPLANFSEESLAKYIWDAVKNPRVDLVNANTRIELFICKNKVYCGTMAYENKEDFESRKSHLRPFSSPSSLHPKIARALVNLSGIRKGESLLDPFCGTGGFLIEAGLMHIKACGYDISKKEVNGCVQNLKHFKIKKYIIKNKNALDINEKIDYVVTDLPYGMNSNVYLEYNEGSINQKSNKINLKNKKKDSIRNLEKFYFEFLMKLRKALKKRAVIVFPGYVDYRRILKKSRFNVEKEFSIYVHRSLTRKIVRIR